MLAVVPWPARMRPFSWAMAKGIKVGSSSSEPSEAWFSARYRSMARPRIVFALRLLGER